MKLFSLPRPLSPLFKATSVLSVLLLCFTVPYLFPVARTISLSYVAQFNNRVCALIFIAGILAFSAVTKGRLGEREAPKEHKRLSKLSLSIALALTLLLIWAQLFEAFPHHMGLESNYNLNRFQMLVSGKRPYRDFEYIYGPILLFGPYLLLKTFHFTAVTAYYVWWGLEWLVGTCMYWFTLRNLPVKLQPVWQNVLFWSLFILRFAFDFSSEGSAYTPVRALCAAFWITVTYTFWIRRKNALLTHFIGIFGVVFSIGISADQALGAGAGLLLWFCLLSITERPSFPRWIVFSFLMMTLTAFGAGMSQQLFYTTSQLSSGAFSFPLLPSIQSSLLLIPYFGAACAGYAAMRSKDYSSLSIPLLLCGIAMLPAALGRCDMGHLLVAYSAFILGAAYLLSYRSLRLFWGGAILASTILPIAAGSLLRTGSLVHAALKSHAFIQQMGLARSKTVSPFNQPGFAVIPPVRATVRTQSAIRLQAPCPIIYRTPNIQPRPFETASQACLDTGYYLVWVDAFTQEAMQRKVRELDKVPRSPVLLYDAPMDQQFVTSDTSMEMLRELEGALILPKPRRTMPDYSVITNYIKENYIPDPAGENGMRVWRPKSIY